MNFRKARIFLSILLVIIGIGFAVFQYLETFHSELASAYNSSKPVAGHSWSEMQCTSDVCITDGKIGMGTDNPQNKLEVTGNIKANGNIYFTGNICDGSGNCLSSLLGGDVALVEGVHTEEDCTTLEGSVASTDFVANQCRFAGSTCPAGWTKYLTWSAWTGGSAINAAGSAWYDCAAVPWGKYASAPFCPHLCNFGNCLNSYSNQYGTITSIGCY